MVVKTKFDIGDKVWICYKDRDEIHVYQDVIKEIVIVGDIEHTPMGTTSIQQIEYIGNICCEGILEEEVIAYDDSNKLIETIRRLENARK